MRQTKRNALDRAVAMLLAMLIIVTLPANALAVAAMPSTVETNLHEKSITVGAETEFVVQTTANDNANKMVVTSFSFENPDTVEKLQYQDEKDGIWKDIPKDTGEGLATVLTDGMTTYRVTFNKSGTQTVTVSVKAAEGQNEVYAETEAKITVNEVPKNKVTVSVNPYTGGTVSLNKAVVDPAKGTKLEVDEDAVVSVDIQAQTGYVIKAVLFGEEQQQIGDDPTEFHGALDIAKVKTDTEIKVSFVKMHTVKVTNKNTEGGVVILNDQTEDSVTVEHGSTANIAINAVPGYQIKSVTVNGADQEVTDKKSFTLKLNSIEADTNVEVDFVKVVTVTVTCDSNGTVELEPGGTAGEVTVHVNSKVEITATPDDGYHVSEVLINKKPQKVSGENGAGYHTVLTVNEEYTIEVTFAENEYQVVALETQNGKVMVQDSKVAHGKSTRVILEPQDGYTVDTVSVVDTIMYLNDQPQGPQGTEVEVIKDGAEIYFTVENITADQTVLVTFKETAKAKQEDISIEETILRKYDSEDGNQTIYVLGKGETLTISTEKNGIRVYDDQNTYVGGGETEKTVKVSGAISKIELYYQAEQEHYEDWHVLPINIVRDLAIGEPNMTPVKDAHEGYYGEDVIIDVSVSDIGISAGLKTVEYLIIKDGVEQSEIVTLYEYKDGDELIYNFKGEGGIIVDASVYNSEDVVVKLHVSDRADNQITKTLPLKINATAPTMKLELTGQKNGYAAGNYYTKERTLTITITDREDTFTQDGINFIVNRKNQTSKIHWDLDRNTGEDKTIKYIGTYIFAVNETYDWSISYTNKVGKTAQKEEASDDIYHFSIDNMAPKDLKISYPRTLAQIILERITFGFYKAPVTVKIQANDIGDDIERLVCICLTEEGEPIIETMRIFDRADLQYERLPFSSIMTASRKFTLLDGEVKNFRGKVSFFAIDRAGNVTSFRDNEQVVIVDEQNPEIHVEYENEQSQDVKIYKNPRKANITILEDNFFQTDVDEGLLKIKVTKKLAGSSESVVIYEAPTFISKGNAHTASIDFTEDGDYILDITYTDRAQNPAKPYQEKFTIDKTPPSVKIVPNGETIGNGYYNGPVTAEVQVNEEHFDASRMKLKITATDIMGRNLPDFSEEKYHQDLKNPEKWQLVNGIWTTDLTFNVSGNYEIEITCKDLAGLAASEPANAKFCIDVDEPCELNVTYDIPLLENSEKTLYGFSQNPVRVTIQAKDLHSGIDHFTYSYKVQEGASDINEGKQDVIIGQDSIWLEDNAFCAEFYIAPQFRGSVSFAAWDKLGNRSVCNKEEVIVVDNKPPVINVTYKGCTQQNGIYYGANCTAVISVTEANFFQEDVTNEKLKIQVSKKTADGQWLTTLKKPTFVREGNTDTYIGEVLLDEGGEYLFQIDYTDSAGVTAEKPHSDMLIIDKAVPQIQLTYDNNSCKNSNQFKEDRMATIQITDPYFVAENVVATIKVNGTVDDEYSDFLRNQNNWSNDGDIYTAEILFTNEAHYTIDIAYTNLAGTANNGIIFKDAVAPLEFTLDKSDPAPSITINDESVLNQKDDSIVFDRFYREEIVVKLDADCGISGLDSLKYQKVSRGSDYDEDGTWIDYDDSTGIVITPSEKAIIYVRAEDRAGRVSIKNSTGIVVDNQNPSGETKAPEIDILPEKANANGYYSDNVEVNLRVVDPKYAGAEESVNGHYSGLKEITYRIYTTDTNAEETGTLFDLTDNTVGAEYDVDHLVSGWSGKIEVNAEKFNSNQIYVEVTAKDNADNIRTSTTAAGEIMIDVTAPEIDVSYDNNLNDSAGYFKSGRTATIVVKERNFSPEGIALTLTNEYGEVPGLSSWTKIAGTGNMDDTKWVATISYTSDGDYDFGISCRDQADLVCEENAVNYNASVAPTSFIIDQTKPTVTVSYDNNAAKNGNYYKDSRVATIVIEERNLDPNGADLDRIEITMTASDNGAAKTVPAVSQWRTAGDKHTATIHYSEDGLYSFDVAVRDKAGNPADDFEEQTFYVDKTLPSLEITGVANNSANKGDVIPVITYSDTNYDPEQVTITLTGANRKNVKLNGSYSDVHNGRVFTFNNFVREKVIDDIYTLTATLTDRAGNTATETVVFSVNRFGSTYALSDSTEKLNGTYVKNPSDVVITETNANELSDIKLTLFKNNETIVLKEGADYKISVDGGNGEWYRYTYTIFAKEFDADGVYKLTVESKDAAGNDAKNNQDTKNTEINFGVDKTLPIINIANLQSNTTYATDNLTVHMSVEDNLKLAKVIVELDGKEFKVWSAEALEEIIKNGGNFTFDIPGDSNDAHKLVVYAIDEAGNGDKISETELPENAEVVKNFYVTVDLWIRFYTNKPLFYGVIVCVLLLVGLLIGIPVYKKKKGTVKK